MSLVVMVVTGVTAFAGEGEVSKRVLDAFKSEFNTAQEVTWTSGSNYYKAEFSMNGQRVFAYYSTSGDLLGLARHISTLQLPVHLLSELKKDYSVYWVSDLFEVSNEEGTRYYVTLENADTKMMLESENDNGWNVYNKKKKV